MRSPQPHVLLKPGNLTHYIWPTGDEMGPWMSSSAKQHWDQVYTTKPAEAVSWFQNEPTPSLDFIAAAGVARDAAVVDVGGGASRLVDRLLDCGFSNVTVMDVSESALNVTKARLGPRATRVAWVVADLTTWDPPVGSFALWHDRAVFHFLVNGAGRGAYLGALARALAPNGFVVLATFAPTGPERCSGLPVCRYSAEALQAMLGSAYELVRSSPQTHVTPIGNRQDFVWCLFRKTRASGDAAAEGRMRVVGGDGLEPPTSTV